MSTKIEIRTLAAELRADEEADEFQIVGTAAAYNSLSKDLGGFREIISPGAFKHSLDGNDDVVALFNHDTSKVLGRTRSGTLKLKDTDRGLTFRCQLDEDQQMHRDLYASIKRGDISECSFAFTVNPNGDSFDEVADRSTGKRFALRTLKDVQLHDVSAVTNPAYGNGATNVGARAEQRCDYDYRYTTTFSKHSGLFTAELAAIDKQTDELLRLRLQRIGAEIAREGK